MSFFLGIVWDRPPAPGVMFTNQDEAVGCSVYGTLCEPIEVHFRSGGKVQTIPEKFVPDSLEHHCYSALMAAACLFEEMENNQPESR